MDDTTETRSMATVATLAAVGVALVLSAGALIVAAAGGGSEATPTTVAAAPAEGLAVDAPTELTVELDEMSITPAEIEIAAGGTLEVVNVGVAGHDLVVEDHDVGTPILEADETATLELAELPPGTYTVYCTVAGHREAGMEGTLTVVDEGDAGEVVDAEPAAEDEGAEADDELADATADAAGYDPNAAPPDGFEARDPRLAPAEDVDVHEVTIRASQVEGEVAPGVSQELWTFDDVVPGPVLRGEVGDIFRVTFVNDGEMGHSIDFHASKVAPNEEMRTIEPGEELTYEFEAKHAGVWMYHCGTTPVLHHTGNGQYGVLIVDPPDLEEVDHEYVFVQSEFYLGPDGEPGDLTKMMDEDFDIVAFNGYANQYVHDPIDEVEVDQRVRVWLLNAGPSENSSFHVIGTIFDAVYKEGSYRLGLDEGNDGGAQALDLQASQGGFVEFSFDTDGVYPFVTHKFANVPKGAVGIFQVGDVEEGAAH